MEERYSRNIPAVSEEDMEKLFQSFKRLDERKNRTIEGTGWGMSIVDGILTMMGSTLEVKSEYGKGSSFSFRIHQSIIDASPIGEYEYHEYSFIIQKGH